MSARSPEPTPPGGVLVGVVPWDLGALPAEDLGSAYRDLGRFVSWLDVMGVRVPACWYVHPWVVEELVLHLHWRAISLTPQPDAARSTPRYVVDWWTSIRRLERDWQELIGHGRYHRVLGDPDGKECAIPAFEDVVADAVADRRGGS